MKIEDPFTLIETLLDRDDGYNPKVLAAKGLLLRGKQAEATAILASLPDHVLSLGQMVADPNKRGALIPDQSAIPDFIKDARKKLAAPTAKPIAEEKKK